jgi:hypothetical protein
LSQLDPPAYLLDEKRGLVRLRGCIAGRLRHGSLPLLATPAPAETSKHHTELASYDKIGYARFANTVMEALRPKRTRCLPSWSLGPPRDVAPSVE